MTNLEPEQITIVRMLQNGHDYIAEWRWLFRDATVRATTSRGRTATLRRDQVQDLVDAGIMAPGYGGSFVLTETGKLL